MSIIEKIKAIKAFFDQYKNKPARKAAEYKGSFVANPTTKVFHCPYCPTLQNIDPVKNVVLRIPRSKIIKEGYKPCKICNP